MTRSDHQHDQRVIKSDNQQKITVWSKNSRFLINFVRTNRKEFWHDYNNFQFEERTRTHNFFFQEKFHSIIAERFWDSQTCSRKNSWKITADKKRQHNWNFVVWTFLSHTSMNSIFFSKVLYGDCCWWCMYHHESSTFVQTMNLRKNWMKNHLELRQYALTEWLMCYSSSCLILMQSRWG